MRRFLQIMGTLLAIMAFMAPSTYAAVNSMDWTGRDPNAPSSGDGIEGPVRETNALHCSLSVVPVRDGVSYYIYGLGRVSCPTFHSGDAYITLRSAGSGSGGYLYADGSGGMYYKTSMKVTTGRFYCRPGASYNMRVAMDFISGNRFKSVSVEQTVRC